MFLEKFLHLKKDKMNPRDKNLEEITKDSEKERYSFINVLKKDFRDLVKYSGFLTFGFLGATSKLYEGPSKDLVRGYAADIFAPAGLYLFSRSMGSSKKASFFGTLIACFYGELAQSTDFLPNPFIRRGGDPYDLIAYTLGGILGVFVDNLIERRKRK